MGGKVLLTNTLGKGQGQELVDRTRLPSMKQWVLRLQAGLQATEGGFARGQRQSGGK